MKQTWTRMVQSKADRENSFKKRRLCTEKKDTKEQDNNEEKQKKRKNYSTRDGLKAEAEIERMKQTFRK